MEKFNNIFINIFEQKKVFYCAIDNVPNFFIGSVNHLLKKNHINNIYNSHLGNVISNNDDFFGKIKSQKIKLFLEKEDCVVLLNHIVSLNDDDLSNYLMNNIRLLCNPLELLMDIRLSSKSLNLILEMSFDKINESTLDKMFFLQSFRKMREVDVNYDNFKKFVLVFQESFKKNDLYNSLLFFLEDKFPEHLQEIQNILGFENKDNQSLFSINNEAFSLRINKNILYKKIRDDNNFVIEDDFVKIFKLIEKTINDNSELLKLENCILSGCSNDCDFYVLFFDKKPDSKTLSNELFSLLVDKLFKEFFHNRQKQVNKDIILDIVNFFILENQLIQDVSAQRKIKI